MKPALTAQPFPSSSLSCLPQVEDVQLPSRALRTSLLWLNLTSSYSFSSNDGKLGITCNKFPNEYYPQSGIIIPIEKLQIINNNTVNNNTTNNYYSDHFIYIIFLMIRYLDHFPEVQTFISINFFYTFFIKFYYLKPIT